jgi:hypothetical protein
MTERKKAVIASLSGFERSDIERAVLLLTWQAREMLGLTEDAFAGHWPLEECINVCSQAAALLSAADALLAEPLVLNGAYNWAPHALFLLPRAVAASKSATENGRVAAGYLADTARYTEGTWEHKHAPKAVQIFNKSIETARREAHRALAELCEMFPESVPTEQVDKTEPVPSDFADRPATELGRWTKEEV